MKGGLVWVERINGQITDAIYNAMKNVKILDQIDRNTRISIKPNLTYPYYKPGITTSPQVIEETVKVLSEYTNHIAIVETEGGYGAWRAEEAFKGHNIYELAKRYDIEVVNLNEEPAEEIKVFIKRKEKNVLLPKRLLYETDLFVTMPVPKIHCMTGLTLAFKNQWGCIPDTMRLRYHHIFDDAIIAINKILKPVVISDGLYFLDINGPMEGVPVKMDLIIASNNVGAFDRYVSELMGFPWERVSHLKRAAELGEMPIRLSDITYNVSPNEINGPKFRLKRSIRNYIALMGFKSRFLTWLGYESWFGRVILHGILYAISGRMVETKK
jgi:uncharacterized protein (DUF362 family)